MPTTAPTLSAQLAFLSEALSPGLDARDCELVETHVSWLLLGREHVFKIKKPVYGPLFDFSTPQARARNARNETRLNQRLAPRVYLGVLALQWDGERMSLVPDRELNSARQTLNWIVWMKRLPKQFMGDSLLARGELSPTHIDALLHVLLPFYRRAPHARTTKTSYLAHFRREQTYNREVLCQTRFELHQAQVTIDALNHAIDACQSALSARAHRVVEGHGDLRPEHACLLDPPVVIDALEFNVRLRHVDPFDELAYFGLERAMENASWVAPKLLADARHALDDALPDAVWWLYTAHRAVLRARLCAAHLLDAQPRLPHRWLPMAQRYLAFAMQALEHRRLTS
ncbi:MAG TPA: hypothetical protein VFS42_07205 [Burkholderiaceae bacterium]|nr:hypothetical protein [Burkholderiaceae bacterium]